MDHHRFGTSASAQRIKTAPQVCIFLCPTLEMMLYPGNGRLCSERDGFSVEYVVSVSSLCLGMNLFSAMLISAAKALLRAIGVLLGEDI